MSEAPTTTPTRPPATVITASDGVHHGTREDRSGDLLADLLAEAGHAPIDRRVVPDEVDDLSTAIAAACADGARLVVVTGGTGLGPRDVTPEALHAVTDRVLPGFGEVMRAVGRASTPLADLSRSVAATRGTSLVLAVPGSPSGARESVEAVLELVPHALDLLAGDTGHGDVSSPPPEHDHAGHDHAEHDHAGHDGAAHDVAAGPDHGEPGHVHDDSCALAHGEGDDDREVGTLMAVFASPLSALLLAWGRELGYRTVLVDPRVAERDAPTAPVTDEDPSPMVVAATPEAADPTTDVVVTDHHRDELVDMLDTALDTDARFIGLMGSARHEGPHVGPLRERGRTDADLDRIVRPIGFDIGSKTPAEIAVATLADLVARRNDRR
ncbi:molybdenum cofactor synthesis domain-containing protein [Salsipaludibacter albus]|uniref:molybdenum cofactor synthesis domain-containing protein n=1 Tax=Salsipaludibacter albus TaxID=2849650 RepID=UPI002368341A|nr:molybdenum cofactor synthesis domain-containing protein [Salsipaludibacter albus]